MTNFVIKKGGVEIRASKHDLVEVSETPDGVVFSFKGGISVNYIDPYMTSGNKQIIKNTADRFGGNQKIIFDLDNNTKPAIVDAT